MAIFPRSSKGELMESVSVNFRLADDGVLTITSLNLPDLRLSGTDYELLFKQLGPEIGRLLLARSDEVSFQTELRVRWAKKE